jgi:hypothetical protein
MPSITKTRACCILHHAVLPGKAGHLADDTGSPARLLRFALRNAAILASSSYLLMAVHLAPQLAVLRHVAYLFTLYGFITLLMDVPGALVSGMLGMRLVPSFDEPWLATSVANFWGRRWNMPAAALLRSVVLVAELPAMHETQSQAWASVCGLAVHAWLPHCRLNAASADQAGCCQARCMCTG